MQEDVNIENFIQCKTVKKNNYIYFHPENEFGNVEYKSKLINPSKTRLYHLSTQMKWRLKEGNDEAFYRIGVEDNGKATGLTKSEMRATLKSLIYMAKTINAKIQVLNKQIVYNNKVQGKEVVRKIANIRVRTILNNQKLIDLRLAILGGTDVGKSTLCGVLTHGTLDNGQGMTRLNVFRHLHEFQSGRTSSICLKFLGFNSNNRLLNYNEFTLEEIIKQSTKFITLIDLAGDRRYLKTTIHGVCSYIPHYCAILINGVTGMTKMTKEHIGLVWALKIPFFAIITKIDLIDKFTYTTVLSNIKNLINNLNNFLVPKHVETEDDVKYSALSIIESNVTQKTVPIFSISNVTGEGINLITQFFSLLSQYDLQQFKKNKVIDNVVNNNDNNINVLFYLNEIFQLEKIGTVVCGLLAKGTIYETDEIQIGPNKTGDYLKGTVQSIQKNNQPVTRIFAGERASIHITISNYLNKSNNNDLNQNMQLRKGMVVIGAKDIGIFCQRFSAKFYLLHHSTKQNKISVGFQGTVYIGSLCRRVVIEKIDNLDFLLPNKWTIVMFKFLQQVEFLQIGMQLIFCECTTKGTGEVLEVYKSN